MREMLRRQGQAEVVSKSTNKIHQTWIPPFSQVLYYCMLVAQSGCPTPCRVFKCSTMWTSFKGATVGELLHHCCRRQCLARSSLARPSTHSKRTCHPLLLLDVVGRRRRRRVGNEGDARSAVPGGRGGDVAKQRVHHAWKKVEETLIESGDREHYKLHTGLNSQVEKADEQSLHKDESVFACAMTCERHRNADTIQIVLGVLRLFSDSIQNKN